MSKDKNPQCPFIQRFVEDLKLARKSERTVQPFVDSASIWAMIQKQATKDHLRWYFGCWFQPGGRQIYAGERQPPESRKSDPKARRAIQKCARSPQSSESYWPQRLTKATKMIYAFMHCVSDHPTQMKPEVSRGRMSKSTTFPDQ